MYKGPEAGEPECVAGVEQRGENSVTRENPQLRNFEALKLFYAQKGKKSPGPVLISILYFIAVSIRSMRCHDSSSYKSHGLLREGNSLFPCPTGVCHPPTPYGL